MHILLSDAGNRVSLSLTRALGRAGHRIDLFEFRRRVHQNGVPGSFRSRWTDGSFLLPDPGRCPDSFLSQLEPRLPDYDVFLPVATNTLYFCSSHRSQLRQAGCRLPLVNRPTLETANNTGKLVDLAQSLDIPVPETFDLSCDEPDLPAPSFFPGVVKLQSDKGLELPPAQRYRIVQSPDETRSALSFFRKHVDRVLLQEWIPGQGLGVSTVVDPDGRPIAGVTHRRIREYPIQGGPSSFCETIRAPDAEQYAFQLLKRLDWTGPAQVEFRRDHRDDTPYLMEINPRFWGSLPLSLASGVNLPSMLVKSLYTGRTRTGDVPFAPAGTRLRFAHLDLVASFQQLFSDTPRTNSIGASWMDQNVHEGLFDFRDPVPAVTMYLQQAPSIL